MILQKNTPIQHRYQLVKKNMFDIQYQLQHQLPSGSILKERVKVETYQKFNNSSALAEYFRIRGKTSWKKGKQLTGMVKTKHKELRYGRYKHQDKITFFLFISLPNTDELVVYQFPKGYDPNNSEIENLFKTLKTTLS